MKKFDKNNISLRQQFDSVSWLEDSGLSESELRAEALKLTENGSGLSHAIVKARTFELILKKSRIAVDREDIFQDKIFGRGIIAAQRAAWEAEVVEENLRDFRSIVSQAHECGAYKASGDYGHTSPNSKLLLEVGISGLLDRVIKYSEREDLSEKQKDFYLSAKICLEALAFFVKRLGEAIEPYNSENSKALYSLAESAPQNIYEAMQLLIVYFFAHEYIGGTRVRTLGRLDVMLYPFYKSDIEKGVYTRSEIKEMIKFFFNKLWAAKVPYDLPLCLGGIDEDGEEATNELTYILVEAYNELDIYSPKIHVRVSDKTPTDFVKLVLNCIRCGNSSFVFLNDNTVIKGLKNVGISERDAKNYVPIGCYEPAVWGKEIGCTGNGGVNLAKAVELAITDGVDLNSGKQISIRTGEISSFDDFVFAVKAHIKFMAERGMDYVREIEKYYDIINPDPLLSAMYDSSVRRGVDVFEGGAEYNNSSYYFYCIASLVDSVCAVKRLVFEEKRISFAALCEVLKNNWQGNEKLRLISKKIPEKYGNNNSVAEGVTKDFAEFCASLVNGKPNSRGGVFKAALFTIDFFVVFGTKTMATPDGRLAGEVLSKNLCASIGQDKNGITALINSVTQFDHAIWPNGTVLDVILHPSAVSGEDGLDAFYSLLKAYMAKGGMALHGNVFDSETLKRAQREPEKYKNLQVRVCGWNAYFVNLSKVEQECFIKQAEEG